MFNKMFTRTPPSQRLRLGFIYNNLRNLLRSILVYQELRQEINKDFETILLAISGRTYQNFRQEIINERFKNHQMDHSKKFDKKNWWNPQ